MKKGKFAKGITVELPDHLNVAATSVKINKVIKACGGKKNPQTAPLLITLCSLSSHLSFCGLLSELRPGEDGKKQNLCIGRLKKSK